MIQYTHDIDRVLFVQLVCNCMSNFGAFKPYMPNEGDDSFWTVDSANDWKVQFYTENRMKIWHRYSDRAAEHALEKWIAYRTGGCNFVNKRKIIVNNKTYQYNIGEYIINIWTPYGIRLNIDMAQFLDCSCSDIERGKNKNYFHVTPKDIEENILRMNL